MDKAIDSRLLAMAKASGSRKKTGGRSSAMKQRKSLATYQKFRDQLGTKAFIGSTGNFIEETIILDIGGRYSKIGFVGEPGPRRICKTHLRLGDYRKSTPYPSQKFKTGVSLLPVVLSLSKKPLSYQTWQEIAELLVNDLLFNQLEIKPDKRRIIVLQDAWWPSPFQNALAYSFFHHECPGVQFIDSLHTALYCTGKTSGLVLDVGYHTSKIQATMHGHILPESRAWKYVGFYSIMQEFKKLMRELAKLDFNEFRVNDEQIENAIARTCFVQPMKYAHKMKARNNNASTNSSDANNGTKNINNTNKNNPKNTKNKGSSSSDELVPNSVSFEFNVKKQSAFCKITPSIRRRICDVLFDEKRANLVHFLCDALLALPIDCRALLINNILLTGGTTQIPGFEARFIQEFKHAVATLSRYAPLRGLAHRFRLLRCEFPANIRMFAGASIYGDITFRFVEELFLTRKQFVSRFVRERIHDWTENYQKSEAEIKADNKISRKYPPLFGLASAGSSAAGDGGSGAGGGSSLGVNRLQSQAASMVSLTNITSPKKAENSLQPIRSLTHADIVRKPQYRGRSTYNTIAQGYPKKAGFSTPRRTIEITSRISTGTPGSSAGSNSTKKRGSMDIMPARSKFGSQLSPLASFPETDAVGSSASNSNTSNASKSGGGGGASSSGGRGGKLRFAVPDLPDHRPDAKYQSMRKTVKFDKPLLSGPLTSTERTSTTTTERTDIDESSSVAFTLIGSQQSLTTPIKEEDEDGS